MIVGRLGNSGELKLRQEISKNCSIPLLKEIVTAYSYTTWAVVSLSTTVKWNYSFGVHSRIVKTLRTSTLLRGLAELNIQSIQGWQWIGHRIQIVLSNAYSNERRVEMHSCNTTYR